ncbi:MAG: TfoX/Sxy family protein [Planctomycetota bacterium]
MTYDGQLVSRLRDIYDTHDLGEVIEKKMFGGVAFMVQGRMSCGVTKDSLMVRVGPDAYEAALKLKGAREMDFTGRPMRGFVHVDQDGFASKRALEAWVKRSLAFVTSLPPK